MSSQLHKCTVLVLNRNWQAIGVKTPAEAICMLASGSATALDVREGGEFVPTRWEDWVLLPVRDSDGSIGAVRGPVRQPTVVIAARYSRVPLRRPKFGARGIWERDGGICQYTGRKLRPSEGNVDHVVPLSRGGPNAWENCVLADKRVNTRKGSRLPDEAGLKLLRRPVRPRSVPISETIQNAHGVADWDWFLGS
jgi:5-methylcytosine-specific restriction endonuclease McrA